MTPSMLRPNDTTTSISRNTTFPNRSVSALKNESYLSDMTGSFSDSTSVAMFPHFNFKVNELSSLSKLISEAEVVGAGRARRVLKISLLVAVLEVEGPISVNVKRGPDAGTAVALLKLIVGDEKGVILRLTAWRDTAEKMSGIDEANHPGIKKGDIVFFKRTSRSAQIRCTP